MSEGFQNIDKLPLGKLLQTSYPNKLGKKRKKNVTSRLKLKGPKKNG